MLYEKLLCILLAATMLMGFTACSNDNADKGRIDSDDANRGNQVGDLCYGANLTAISENGMAISTFDPTELGKITVINFWAYWCPPCVGELPHFEEVAEEYADEVAVVAVHCDNLQKGQEFIGENHPNSAIRFAADREDEKDPYAYYTALGGSGSIPYTVIIDADGIIRYKFTGAITYEALVDAIEDCADPKEDETPQTHTAKVVDVALCKEEYAIAVGKEDTALLNQVNAFLHEVTSDGTLDAIINNYFGDDTPATITSAKEDASRNQLVVATSTGFEPFEMVQNGQYTGIDIELAAALAKYLGKELVIKDMAFEAVVASVRQGMCDVAIAGLMATSQREKDVAFSDPYYIADQTLVVPDDCTAFDKCQTAEDVVEVLEQVKCKIGCQKGTTGALYIDGDQGYGFSGLAQATKKEYDYAAQAILAMMNGEIDYVIVDKSTANALVKSLNG